MQTNLLNAVGHPSTFVLPCTTKTTGESILRVELPRGMDYPHPVDVGDAYGEMKCSDCHG